jgi:hypothetical protein
MLEWDCLSERMTNDTKLAQEILNYLQAHPHAGDSLEGIARWWVMCQRLSDSVEEVQHALEELKARGNVVEYLTSDGRTMYSLHDTE